MTNCCSSTQNNISFFFLYKYFDDLSWQSGERQETGTETDVYNMQQRFPSQELNLNLNRETSRLLEDNDLLDHNDTSWKLLSFKHSGIRHIDLLMSPWVLKTFYNIG